MKRRIGSVAKYYNIHMVSERVLREFSRLLKEMSKLAQGHGTKASGGVLTELTRLYPPNSWSNGEKEAFRQLFRGYNRGKYWANIALGYLDDVTVLQITQVIMEDNSRFSEQMKELGKVMALSVSVSRETA